MVFSLIAYLSQNRKLKDQRETGKRMHQSFLGKHDGNVTQELLLSTLYFSLSGQVKNLEKASHTLLLIPSIQETEEAY
jgi:hypothetical protein